RDQSGTLFLGLFQDDGRVGTEGRFDQRLAGGANFGPPLAVQLFDPRGVMAGSLVVLLPDGVDDDGIGRYLLQGPVRQFCQLRRKLMLLGNGGGRQRQGGGDRRGRQQAVETGV